MCVSHCGGQRNHESWGQPPQNRLGCSISEYRFVVPSTNCSHLSCDIFHHEDWPCMGWSMARLTLAVQCHTQHHVPSKACSANATSTCHADADECEALQVWHAVPACTITMLHELSLVASRNLLTRSDHLGVKWMQPPVTLACRVR